MGCFATLPLHPSDLWLALRPAVARLSRACHPLLFRPPTSAQPAGLIVAGLSPFLARANCSSASGTSFRLRVHYQIQPTLATPTSTEPIALLVVCASASNAADLAQNRVCRRPFLLQQNQDPPRPSACRHFAVAAVTATPPDSPDDVRNMTLSTTRTTILPRRAREP